MRNSSKNNSINNSTVKKYINILNGEEALRLLMAGKKLQGVLYYDARIGLVYKPNNPPTPNRNNEFLLGRTDFGRVTENSQFIKVYQLYPKVMGTRRMLNAVDREANDVKDVIETSNIINNV